VGEENQPERHAEEQQAQRLKGIERLHEKSSANYFKSVIRTLRNFSRKAKPSPVPAALPGIQVQSLANCQEQREIMAKVETIDVACGRGDAVGLNTIIRGMACAAISTPYVRTAGATLEGGA
jgi:hypothetical protein